MANMLYNGVELPDINEVWDKETHPYAGIGSFGVNWMFAALDFEVYADVSKSGYYASSAGKIDQYLCQNGEWVLVSSQNMDAGNLLTSFSQVTFTWASFNILDNNGSVYLAASDPVDPNAPAEPTYTYDKTAFLSGMAMGLCGKGDPTFTGGTDAFTKGYLTGAELRRKRVIPASTPSANGDGFALYNGVKLPNITQFSSYDDFGSAMIYSYDISAYANGHFYHLVYNNASNDRVNCYLVTTAELVSLVSQIGLDISAPYVWTEHANITLDGLVSSVFWAGSDFSINESIAPYVSDPIPLDGYTVIEWDGNTEGLEELTLMGMSELYKVSDIIIPASSINSAIIVLSAGSSRVTLTPSSNRTYAVNSQIFDSEYLIEYYYGTLDGTTTRMNSLAAAVNVPSAGVTGSYFWAGTFADSVDGYTPILAYKA